MQNHSFYMVVYDISEPKIRNQVIVLLEEFGFFRTQCSVYVSQLSPQQVTLFNLKIDLIVKEFPQNIDMIFIPILCNQQRYSHHVPKTHVLTQPIEQLLIQDQDSLCI